MKKIINEWNKDFSRKNIEKIKFQVYIWNNIHYLRTYRWFSQSDLAEKAETTQRIISQIENWDYNPSIDFLSKISNVLDVNLEILTKEKINWRLVEFFDYYMKKYKNIDILKAIKLAYFSDLEFLEEFKRKFTWLNYIRWNFWPFDEKIYILKDIYSKIDENTVENKKPFKKYVFLKDSDEKFLDKIFTKYASKNWVELMKMSYETEPMKKLWATLGWTENMGAVVL